MFTLRNNSCWLVLALSLAFSVPHARAEDATTDKSGIAGRVQLSAATTLGSVHYHHAGTENPDDFGASLGSYSVPFGFGGPSLLSAIGIGYALDEHWVPSLSGSVYHVDASSSGARASNSWTVTPGLRYVLGSPHTGFARPFVDADVSFGRQSYGFGPAMQTYRAGIGAGVQLQVGERVSVDPFVGLSYAYAYQRPFTSADLGFYAAAVDDHYVALTGGFALSLWL